MKCPHCRGELEVVYMDGNLPVWQCKDCKQLWKHIFPELLKERDKCERIGVGKILIERGWVRVKRII